MLTFVLYHSVVSLSRSTLHSFYSAFILLGRSLFSLFIPIERSSILSCIRRLSFVLFKANGWFAFKLTRKYKKKTFAVLAARDFLHLTCHSSMRVPSLCTKRHGSHFPFLRTSRKMIEATDVITLRISNDKQTSAFSSMINERQRSGGFSFATVRLLVSTYPFSPLLDNHRHAHSPRTPSQRDRHRHLPARRHARSLPRLCQSQPPF